MTKTEGVADWLICTVHRVTPNCAWWAFGFTQKSNNKIKVLMIVLNNNNATISILTSGIDVALTVWGAKMVQDTLINNTVNVWLSHRALLIAFHSFFLSRSTCQNALLSSTRHRVCLGHWNVTCLDESTHWVKSSKEVGGHLSSETPSEG